MGTVPQGDQKSVRFGQYAQFGEDRTLRGIFGPNYIGICFEVGAFDGVSGSNTLAFEEAGWSCFLVEPNPLLAKAIRARRSARLYECAVGDGPGKVTLSIPEGAETLASVSDDPVQNARMVGVSRHVSTVEVEQRRIDDLIEDAAVQSIDFITIDVEGYELDALRGFDLERWKPRIVILEDNSSGTDQQVPIWMETRGYVRFKSSGCNDWYCRKTDPLAARFSIVTTEFIKLLKAYKKVTTSFILRSTG